MVFFLTFKVPVHFPKEGSVKLLSGQIDRMRELNNWNELQGKTS